MIRPSTPTMLALILALLVVGVYGWLTGAWR